MLRDFVEIIGIDPVSSFPVLTPAERFTQFITEETLIIPEQKPDIGQITSLMAEASITNYRAIITPTGLKVIVNGELNEKVIYTADEPTQSVHSAHFVNQFCTFIEIPLTLPTGTSSVLQLLQTLGLTLDDVLASPPNIIIEDISIRLIDGRTVKKCVVLFTWGTVNALLVPFLTPVTP